MNHFKQALQQERPVFGQMVLDLFSPGIGPMLAAAGLEFVIFDMEHGRCGIESAAELIASCRGLEIAPMIRVPDQGAAPLSRVLDLGAKGVMVPRVETAVQMRDIVAQLKYAPEGRRGVALGIARKHDVAAGFLPATPEQTLHWIRKGFRAISLGSDVGVFLAAVREFRREVAEGLSRGSS